MKTNLFALLAALFMLSSCSRSEDDMSEQTNTETPFFNLKVGNEWVYKTYDREDFTSQLKPNGKVDSLKIVESVSLNNKTYAKVRHAERNMNYPTVPNDQNTYYEYWRVNAKGHLVSLNSYYFNQGDTADSREAVKHAGRDYDYSFKDLSFSEYGITIYKLYPQTNITVDGKSYNVSPYNGQFTPNSGHNYSDLFAKLVENNYKEGVGLVKSVCHSVRGTYNFEKHLVSYSLK